MAAIEWLRFLGGAFLLLFGLVIFLIEMIGVFRFKYVLNRMQAAAMGDTLGIGFSLVGLILMGGFTFTSLKLFLVIVFLWFSSPASSHLIARLEVATDEEPEKHYRRYTIRELEEKLHGAAENVGGTAADTRCREEAANIVHTEAQTSTVQKWEQGGAPKTEPTTADGSDGASGAGPAQKEA